MIVVAEESDIFEVFSKDFSGFASFFSIDIGFGFGIGIGIDGGRIDDCLEIELAAA